MHSVAPNDITRAEVEEETSHWQGLVDRARSRADLQTNGLDEEEYVLQEKDFLWEIGCKVSFTNILLSSNSEVRR